MKSWCLILLFTITNLYAESLNICFTGTTVKQFPKYGDAFINGARLALDETPTKRKVNLKKFFYDRTPLAPLTELKKMLKDDCHAIIGFSTGNDLFIIKEELKTNPVFVASIYGDLLPQTKEIEHLISIQPSEDYLLNHLFKKVKSKANDKVLLITAVDRLSMVRYKEAYLKLLKGKVVELDVFEQFQNIESLNKYLKNNDFSFDKVVLLTRSALGATIIDKINKKTSNKFKILGTKYFGSSSLPAFLNYLENKNVEAFFTRHNCLCDEDAKYQNFISRYQAKFEVAPMVISANSYDLTKFIIESANNIKFNEIVRDKLIKELKKNTYFGLSGVHIKKGLNVHHSKSFTINVTKDGYKEIK